MKYTDKEWKPIQDRINFFFDKHMGVTAAAAALGIHMSQLSVMASGRKKMIGKETLDKLGMERVVIFRVKEEKDEAEDRK